MEESTAPVGSPATRPATRDGIAEFYCWAPPVDDDATAKAELARDFPGWSILHTDRGRWWALRLPRIDPATRQVAIHAVSEVIADTPEALREKLTEAVK